MTELSPSVLALRADLRRAIRRDHVRRRRRRRAIRAVALSTATLAAVSASALGAGDALGVIDLGGGVSVAPATTFPVWDGETASFVAGGAGTPFIYHLTGGPAQSVGCGPADPDPTNDIYITSDTALTVAQLKQLSDLADGATPNADVHIPGVTSIRNASCPGSVFVLTPFDAGSP